MRRRRFDNLLIDIDGEMFRIGRRRGRRLERAQEVEGNKWLLTDFGGNPPRMQSVEAPPRYAQLLLLRRLRETGELESQGQVLCHRRRKSGVNNTDVFFTAVDGAMLSRYRDDAHNDPNHHLLFSLHSLLLTALDSYAGDRMTAVLFEHGRHVDIIIGRRGQPIQASRVSSYANDERARESLAEVARGELQSLCDAAHVKLEQLVYVTWMVTHESESDSTTNTITAFGGATTGVAGGTGSSTIWGASTVADTRLDQVVDTEWARALARTLEIECQVLKIERIRLENDEVVLTSVPSALRDLNVSETVSPPLDELRYRAHRAAPAVVLGLWLLSLAVFGAGLLLQRSADTKLTASSELLTKSPVATMAGITPLNSGYADAVTFAGELSRLRRLPSFAEVMTDLSSARHGPLFLEHVRLDYSGKRDGVTVEVDGVIREEFGEASTAHKEFLSALTAMGYHIVESRFDTNVQELDFHLKAFRSGM